MERLSFFRKWHSLCDSTAYPLVALQARKCHNWPFSMGICFLSYCYWRIVTVNSYCYWSVTEEYLWFGKGCSWSHLFTQKASSCSSVNLQKVSFCRIPSQVEASDLACSCSKVFDVCIYLWRSSLLREIHRHYLLGEMGKAFRKPHCFSNGTF